VLCLISAKLKEGKSRQFREQREYNSRIFRVFQYRCSWLW